MGATRLPSEMLSKNRSNRDHGGSGAFQVSQVLRSLLYQKEGLRRRRGGLRSKVPAATISAQIPVYVFDSHVDWRSANIERRRSSSSQKERSRAPAELCWHGHCQCTGKGKLIGTAVQYVQVAETNSLDLLSVSGGKSKVLHYVITY
jgi:hypothetical protein